MSFFKYADDAEIVADYLTEVDTDNAEQMEVVARRNEAVSAYVDHFCRRTQFGRAIGYFLPASATATPRQFRGDNKNFIVLPTHVPGSVSVSGIAPSAYYEHDVNGWLYVKVADGIEYDLQFSRYWSAGRVYTITARWGYAETPAPIIEAVKMTVALWYGKGQGILGDVSPDGFVIERDIPVSAKALLTPFIRNEFEPQ